MVTVTPTGPSAAPAGTTTVSTPSFTTVGVAELAPKDTEVAVARPDPVSVTVSPPAVTPETGDRPDLNGGPM
ncbi:hypothetical protein GCM10011588_58500 [Nocardia jinanensis]|uniref:Uncharacterized protein n=1 Tax=Nocardia jinanensis TaxID=382504 RepID=A0A917VYA6_9NOCA|nr:hypothetical protein GCM10011588_58500 [Nocardia jinanensis]